MVKIKTYQELFDYHIDNSDKNWIEKLCKEYAAQFIDLAANLGDKWENSGELSEEILKLKQQIK